MDRIVESTGARISYTVEGPPDRPVLLFINSIGTTRDLWLPQVPALVGTYRVIRYDARGHGSSSVPDGDYSIEQLGRDALAILDAEGARTGTRVRHLAGRTHRDVARRERARPRREPRARQYRGAHRHRAVVDRSHRTGAGARHARRGRNGDAADGSLPDFRQRHADVATRFKIDGRGVPADGLSGMLCGAAGRGSARGDLENQLPRACDRGLHRRCRHRPKRFGSSTSASPARRC